MASSNRADRIDHLYKALRKHYKPIGDTSDRKVLDCLLYACCLEDASYEAADEAFAKLQQAYFDANEIRVTTVAELAESLTSLPKAAAAAGRIKKSLQSLFEARYSFDIDDLKKANLGKAIEELSGWEGTTKFVMAYVTQHAFGGHSIPIDNQILSICVALDLLTLAEAQKGILPGVERAIPKNKGLEFSSLLQQFAVEYSTDLHHPVVNAVFKEMGVSNKVRVSVVAAVPAKDEKAPLAGTAQHLEATNAKAKADKQLAALETAEATTKTTSKTASKESPSAAKGKATKMAAGNPVASSGKSEIVSDSKSKDSVDSKKTTGKAETKPAPKGKEIPPAKSPAADKASTKSVALPATKSATPQPAKSDAKSTIKSGSNAKPSDAKAADSKTADGKSPKKAESKSVEPAAKASSAKVTSKPAKTQPEKAADKPAAKKPPSKPPVKVPSKPATPAPTSKKGTASKQLPVKAATKKNTKPR